MLSEFLLRPIFLINTRKKLTVKSIFNFFQICIAHIPIHPRRFLSVELTPRHFICKTAFF
jgi:hypothetical protein